MRRILLRFTVFLLLFSVFGSIAQEGTYRIKFEHFAESRGDYEPGSLLEIPYSDVVVLNNSLNTSSGFGLTLNFHGNVVVIDQMDVMPDGTTQVVLRREDGRNFYGYKPTIKAILTRTDMMNN